MLSNNQEELLLLVRNRRKAENLFSIAELAQFLEVSVRSIRRMHEKNVAPPRIRRSRSLMYPVGGVLSWLPQHVSPSSPQVAGNDASETEGHGQGHNSPERDASR